jgi:hypothetical protein
VMALVTYTLLSALASGLQSRFHPEVLGYSLSKAMLVVIGEFCAIKLGCYLLDVKGSGASGVELIGYGGYKFVGYVISRPNWVLRRCSKAMAFKLRTADSQYHRNGPTRFPTSRTPNFNPSIPIRIRRQLFLSRKSTSLLNETHS